MTRGKIYMLNLTTYVLAEMLTVRTEHNGKLALASDLNVDTWEHICEATIFFVENVSKEGMPLSHSH